MNSFYFIAVYCYSFCYTNIKRSLHLCFLKQFEGIEIKFLRGRQDLVLQIYSRWNVLAGSVYCNEALFNALKYYSLKV